MTDISTLTPLATATFGSDPQDHALVQDCLTGLGRWAVRFREIASFTGLLSDAAAGKVDLLVLNDHGPGGDTEALLRRLRKAGFEAAILVLVDETSEPRSLLRAGADATLDRSNPEPIFVDSIIAVAMSLPHRGR